eukprot:g2214.t1
MGSTTSTTKTSSSMDTKEDSKTDELFLQKDNVYSVVYANSESVSSTPIYRAPQACDRKELLSDIVLSGGKRVRTLWDVWTQGVESSGSGPCMGFRGTATRHAKSARRAKTRRQQQQRRRCESLLDEKRADSDGSDNMETGEEEGAEDSTPYQWMTYDEVNARVRRFGSGLIAARLVDPCDEMGEIDPPRPGGAAPDMIPSVASTKSSSSSKTRLLGIFLKNCMEWNICEHACSGYGVTLCPIYETSPPKTVLHILRETRMRTVVCGVDQVRKLMSLRRSCPDLKCLVVVGGGSKPLTPSSTFEKKMASGDLRVVTFEFVEKIGKRAPSEPTPPKPSDVATLCYTSGTTGLPKGAMLTHRNLVSAAAGILACPGVEILSDAVHLCYLPLAHIFERLVQIAVRVRGGSVGYFRGDTAKIVDDLRALRPTIFPSVPRLFNRIFERITRTAQSKSAVERSLFSAALKSKSYHLQRSGTYDHALWDAVVFKKIKAAVGLDRVSYLITGSAPIAPHVVEFLRAVFGCPTIEGYGLTETTAGGTCTTANDAGTTGHVGGPLACVEMKLVDVPEMGYFAKDGRGEVCIRGPTVFQGYFRKTKATREVLDEKTGWLRTGDVGVILPGSGALKIVDRRKNIFKLAQGEYVVPEKIEASCCLRSQWISQMFVHGDSLQSKLVAIVVLDEEEMRRKNKGKKTKSADDIRKLVLRDIARSSKKAHLFGFETVRNVHVASEPFSVENGMLTPTFKLRRAKVKEAYTKEIEAMQASFEVAGRKGLRQVAVVQCE